MEHPIMVDAEFSARLESAEWRPCLPFIEGLQREKPELHAEHKIVAGGRMMYGGPQSPMNHIIGMGLNGPVSKDEMDEVEEFYRSRKAVCEIVVSPYVDPSLMQHLKERGYGVTEWNSVLIRKLDCDEKFEPEKIEVCPVTQEEALRWSEVVGRGFADIAPGLAPDFFVPFASISGAICFIAYIEGQAVGGAGGATFPEAGIAPMYGASTLPEFRNRGVQSALHRARLKAAANAGCEFGVVSTLPGSVSQRNAERNGYRLAYTKIAVQREV
ncbi:MAG TPA: GNAT family N-acetyltransferase [Terriglobales bacterium]|nr:GNAT family N-acetyltransferase [Terriglobales bacterium]